MYIKINNIFFLKIFIIFVFGRRRILFYMSMLNDYVEFYSHGCEKTSKKFDSYNEAVDMINEHFLSYGFVVRNGVPIDPLYLDIKFKDFAISKDGRVYSFICDREGGPVGYLANELSSSSHPVFRNKLKFYKSLW